MWIDAEFILVYNDTKISENGTQLAEKSSFFKRVLKMGNFGQNAKGGPFTKVSKSADFLAELRKAIPVDFFCSFVDNVST